MELDFSVQIFEKYTNIKFNEQLYGESRVVPRGRAGGRKDKHDEVNRHFLQSCERA